MKKHILERTTKYDKGYPMEVGYAWAPAVIDDFPLAQMHRKPAPYGIGVSEKSKSVNGTLFYQKTALGHTLTYNALRGNIHTNLGIAKDKIKWPGKKAIKATKFSLYNQADVATESVKGKAIRDLVRKDSYVLQDSGGFQLVSGVADFVDPLQVARKHTLYADSGVSLDLPVSGVNDKAFALATAQMLIANTRVILTNVPPQVKVMNICHGATLEIRGAYLDAVIKEPAHSLCIAGLRKAATSHENDFDRSSPFAFASHILLAILKTEKIYQHYHVLGVATPWQMALIALIAHQHQKIVTSDSASHTLSAKSGLLLDYAERSAYKSLGRHITSYSQMYCSCPMCYELKDSLWYKVGAHWMPAIHNMYALLRIGEKFDHLAQVLLHENLAEPVIVKHLMRNLPGLPHKVSHDFQRAVRLIRNTTKVEQLRNLPEGGKNIGLFAGAAKEKISPRQIEVVQKYEKYHNAKWL